MSRLTRLTTTRLRNRLRRPWAIRPSILRGGPEMAPALPQPRTAIETGTQPSDVGATVMAPALPPRRTAIEACRPALGGFAQTPARATHWHWPATGLGRGAVSSWVLG